MQTWSWKLSILDCAKLFANILLLLIVSRGDVGLWPVCFNMFKFLGVCWRGGGILHTRRDVIDFADVSPAPVPSVKVTKVEGAVVVAETGGAADLATAVVANEHEQMDLLTSDEHFGSTSPKSVGEFAAPNSDGADLELAPAGRPANLVARSPRQGLHQNACVLQALWLLVVPCRRARSMTVRTLTMMLGTRAGPAMPMPPGTCFCPCMRQ